MKILTIIIFLWFAAPCYAQSLLNGSFEDRPKGQPETPSHWLMKTTQSRVQMSPRRARTGRISLRIANESADSSSVVAQQVDASAWHGELVRLSGWYRREGVRETPGALIAEVVGPAGTLNQTRSGEQLGAASRWTELDAVVFVPPEADSLSLRFEFFGAGDVWLDDLQLERFELAAGEPAPQVRRYIEDAVALIRGNALEADELNWEEIEREALTLVAGGREPADAYPAIEYMLERLGTPGSRLIPPDAEQSDARSNEARPSTRVERERFGVISAPPLTRASAVDAQKYIDEAHAALSQLEVQNICAYVIDMRATQGDDVVAMLTAFSPLLGQGRIGGRVGIGGRTEFFRNVDGSVRAGKGVLAKANQPATIPKRPVALLIDRETVGAGEALAVAFQARKGSRSFGMDTGGQPQEFRRLKLSDGATIVVAATYPSDRLGRVFTETIKPDVRVRPRLGGDRVLRRALDWLDDQEECSD